MSSVIQIAANRRNAQKSTGPRTESGKAASRRNAMKSGIYAETLSIRCEYPDELERLTAEYHREFQPATPRERDLVDSMVRNEWFLRRMGLVETQLWSHHFQKIDSSFPTDRFDNLQRRFPLGQAFVALSRDLERLQRRINALQRSNRAAQQELESLRARPDRDDLAEAVEPAATYDPNGFVPSEVVQAPSPARDLQVDSVAEPAPIPNPQSPIPATQTAPPDDRTEPSPEPQTPAAPIPDLSTLPSRPLIPEPPAAAAL